MNIKKLFTADYELHASAKMLYPYIQSPVGLSEWLAENVTISPEKVYTFKWGNEEHKAIITSQKLNHFVKFKYLPESNSDKKNPSYLELSLEVNDITQSTYLKISDYSDFDDMEELSELWDSCIDQLKNIVGG